MNAQGIVNQHMKDLEKLQGLIDKIERAFPESVDMLTKLIDCKNKVLQNINYMVVNDEAIMAELEKWLKKRRDEFGDQKTSLGNTKAQNQWQILDDILGDVRDAAATGQFPWDVKEDD